MRHALLIGLLAAGSLSGGAARSEPPRDNPGRPADPMPARTERGAYLGLGASPAPRSLRRQLDLPQGVGLVVDVVTPNSPAAEAGLRADDLLHKLNDQILVNPQQLAVLVRTFKPGDTLKVTVFRAGKPVELSAKLVEKELRPLDEMRLGGDPFNSPFNSPFGIGPFGNGGPDAQLERLRAAVARQRQQEQDQPRGDQDRRPPAAPAAVDGGDAVDPFPPGLLTTESFALSWNDGIVSMRITADGGRRTLVARDKAGTELYNGPIDTDAQRDALPPEVKERLPKVGPPGLFRREAEGKGDGKAGDRPAASQPAATRPAERVP